MQDLKKEAMLKKVVVILFVFVIMMAVFIGYQHYRLEKCQNAYELGYSECIENVEKALGIEVNDWFIPNASENEWPQQ